MASKEWEMVQQKAFTRWINAHLRKRQRAINDVMTDLKDGTSLINLYEIISEERFTQKWYAKPTSKFQEIANLSLVLGKINSFVASVGIKVQFSAEQIMEGVKQQILGLIWCLIHKFEIQDISEEELSAREGLLLWCKKKTHGYKDVNIKDFNYSWEDGLGFAALIHRHRPDLIDFDSLNKENKLENLQKVFELAEKALDIPQLLDAADMIKYKPDDKSVMAYVAYYWKKFAGSAKNEKAAKLIGGALKKQKELQEQEHDYERRAKVLVAWIAEHSATLSDTDFAPYNSEKKALAKNAEFKNFKNKEKPPKLTEKSDLEVLLSNIRSKQKNEGFPIYNPPEELDTPAIAGQWDKLNVLQEKFETLISAHIALMKRLEILLGRVRNRSQKVSQWQEEKITSLAAEDPMKFETIHGLQARVQIHQTFAAEVANIDKALNQVKEFSADIITHKHEAAPEVENILATLPARQQEVLQASDAMIDRFQKEKERREDIVRRSLEYAKKSEEMNLYCDDAIMTLGEPVRAQSVKDVETLQALVGNIEQDVATNEKLIAELQELHEGLQRDGAKIQEFSKCPLEETVGNFEQVKGLIGGKKKELENELVVQKEREMVLGHFAQLIKQYNEFIEAEKHKINAHVDGTLEHQREVISKNGSASIEGSKKHHHECAEAYKKLEEMDIAEQSPVSLQALTVLSEQVPAVVRARLELIDQQLVAQKATGLTPEQVKEIKDTFDHFDKDRDGQLTKLDFKACCAAIGEDIPDEELNHVFSGYDKNGDGKISFDEFVEFMVKLNKQSTGYEEVLASFSQIAGGAEFITEAQLRGALEKTDADDLVSKMPKVGAGYDYKAYLAQAYGK